MMRARRVRIFSPLHQDARNGRRTPPRPPRVRCSLTGQQLSEKLRQLVTLFDFDRDLFLDKSELIAMTATIVRLLEAMGYFKVHISGPTHKKGARKWGS